MGINLEKKRLGLEIYRMGSTLGPIIVYHVVVPKQSWRQKMISKYFCLAWAFKSTLQDEGMFDLADICFHNLLAYFKQL